MNYLYIIIYIILYFNLKKIFLKKCELFYLYVFFNNIDQTKFICYFFALIEVGLD